MSGTRIGTIIPWSAALRSKPSIDPRHPYNGILKDLPHGTQVTVLGQQGAWLNVQVKLGNKTVTGYLSQELVRIVSQAAPVKARAPVTPVKPRQVTAARPLPAQPTRDQILDALQTVLDVVGLIPGVGEVADVTNAGISAMRGNYVDAALSLISVIPGAGDAIGKGAKYALKIRDAGVASKTLAALRKVDIAGFFKKLAQHPELVKYVDALKRALTTLEQQLAQIAGMHTPQLAYAGAHNVPARATTQVPARPAQNTVAQMSGNVAGAYKRGDHVFNHGLTKLALKTPKHSVLKEALDKFQKGLKDIEVMGGFNLVANKGAHGPDLNSKLFGEGLTELRKAWEQLDSVLGNPKANAQHRAAAVTWATQTLRKLRHASFDKDAVLAGTRGMNAADARKFKEKVEQTAKQLDKVFDGLAHDIEKFMPSVGAVGQSMAGFRGTTPRKKAR